MINFLSRRYLLELRVSSFFTTRQERKRLLREVMGAGQELIRFEALERSRSYLEREITGQGEMIFQLSHELEVVQTQFTLIRWNLLRLDKEEVEMMREIVLREAERQQLVREIRLAQGTNLTVYATESLSESLPCRLECGSHSGLLTSTEEKVVHLVKQRVASETRLKKLRYECDQLENELQRKRGKLSQ